MGGRRALRWVLAAAPGCVLVVGSWSHRWFAEDAFIFLRVVDNVVAGNGPVFNAGERVEATTSPLWLALLVVGRVLGAWALPLEWIGVLLGIVLAVAGLALAQWGAGRLWRDVEPGAVMVPAGALVLASIPVVWDFVPSGLEVGLAVSWVAAAWAVTVRVAQRAGHRARWWEPVVVGLGPLVRPDLAIVALVLGAALLFVCRRGTRTRVVVTAAVLPMAYQLFRMGYYGALVPNTGIAKEGGRAEWGRGLDYLGDTASTYRLGIPFAILLAVVAVCGRALVRRLDRGELVVLGAPVVAGALHLAWVARVGGDYMHGRLAIFGIATMLLPVASLPFPRRAPATGPARDRVARAARLGGLVLVGSWAAWIATSVRYSEPPGWGEPGTGVWIQDTRESWAGSRNPVTVDDYHDHFALTAAEMMRGDGALGHDKVVFGWRDVMALPEGEGIWYVNGTVGLLGYASGIGVRIFDPVGLANAVSARTGVGTGMVGVPGHEKLLSREWVVAILVPPTTPGGDPGSGDPAGDPAVEAARRALSCGDLRDLRSATTGPLTLGRFLSNIGDSSRLTALRVDADPFVAEAELCSDAAAGR